jgi:hypothetical protein
VEAVELAVTELTTGAVKSPEVKLHVVVADRPSK